MKIDPNTMMFQDMTQAEAREVEEVASKVILEGGVPVDHPILKEWLEVCGFSDHRALLVMCTVFPGRALLSVLRHIREQERKASFGDSTDLYMR